MNSPRTYRMRARAAAVEETRRRILDATFALSADRLISDISLDAVAQLAGVSVQTVLRQFGSRASLLETTVNYASKIVAAERQAPAGNVAEALTVLVDHYEKRGDTAVMMLAQETADAVVAQVVRQGRVLHESWVREVFRPQLQRLDEQRRQEATELLVVATDVYVWKLLRRDRGLAREVVEQRMNWLVAAVLAGPEVEPPSTD